MKNAIQIGTLKTWNEVCDLFEEKEKELIADAEKFKQMKQALELHEKKPLDHRAMYLPGANSTSHALSTAQQKKKTVMQNQLRTQLCLQLMQRLDACLMEIVTDAECQVT